MCDYIQQYLGRRNKRIEQLDPLPIIIRWLDSPRMNGALIIIDKHVRYLLENDGIKKLDEWFLSGDKTFNSITAERYIIGYLQQNNVGLEYNLSGDGVDAILYSRDGPIGIEITTLNDFVAEWIFIERLNAYLDERGYLHKYRADITYSSGRIVSATKGGSIYQYINSVGKAIVDEDTRALEELGVSLETNQYRPGFISWHIDDTNSSNWFEVLTYKLFLKLRQPAKAKQLKQYRQNLIFVGVNHSSPANWSFPDALCDVTNETGRWGEEIQAISRFWEGQLPSLNSVIGVCYFFYSLDKEAPFYPLRIFWRSSTDRIDINL